MREMARFLLEKYPSFDGLAGFDSEQSYSIVVGKGQTMTVEQLNAGNKRTTLWLTDPKGEDVSDADLNASRDLYD